MRVAVVCDSLTEVAQHLGRAPIFLVYDEVDGKPVLKEQRDNPLAAHSHVCDGPHEEKPGHHSHDRLVEALADCRYVVARGMGRRIAADLEARGIKPAIVDRDLSPFDAAALALAGKADGSIGYCNCGEK